MDDFIDGEIEEFLDVMEIQGVDQTDGKKWTECGNRRILGGYNKMADGIIN